MATKIYFDGECVTRVYDCFLKTYSIDPPDVRTVTGEIAGVDGLIDATEWLGRPIFENRDGKFEFLFLPDGGWRDILVRVNAFRNKFHGRTVKIETDDEPGYYTGRLSFENVSNVKGSAQFVVNADLEPFRYVDHSFSFKPDSTVRAAYISNLGSVPITVTATANSGASWYVNVYREASSSYAQHVSVSASATKTLTIAAGFIGRVYCYVNGTAADGAEISLSYTEVSV